ncbi:uncharacterized protein LOC131025889 [Salvia miltiorrhiza]|uniref:uncharacterized protein LOC131025889 n=1 Tax=Salvia miltiorrhiza TaxID=226208 RepID=UPI0025ACF2C5|nr:uncharacterized protein LOC131025889 [Salvia miltiorrhiza]
MSQTSVLSSSGDCDRAGLEGINLNAQFAVTTDPKVEEIASILPSTKQRGGYTPAETTLVCRLYAEATCNSIKGADQKGACYWGDILMKYNAQQPPGTIQRDVRQIKSHFQRVQKDVKLWEAIYDKCWENWGSGMSYEQITTQATQMYAFEHECIFKYPHAWHVLHECQKFVTIGEDVHSSKQLKVSDGRHTTTSSEPSIYTRPQCQKEAKKDKGKKKTESSDEQT